MKRITVYLDENTHDWLTKIAEQEDRPLTFVAEKLIQQAIKERERKKKNKTDGLQPGKN